MKPSPTILTILAVAWGIGLFVGLPGRSLAQPTAFTYQGRLNDGGSVANGIYDFRFSLFGSVQGFTQVGDSLTNLSLTVASGLFAAILDFGKSAFDGSDRWLEIGVR